MGYVKKKAPGEFKSSQQTAKAPSSHSTSIHCILTHCCVPTFNSDLVAAFLSSSEIQESI